MIQQRYHPFAFVVIAVHIGLSVLIQNPARSDEIDVSISPAKPKQGDTIIISVSPPEVPGATIIFRNRSYSMFRSGERLHALIGTSPDTPAGQHNFVIETSGAEYQWMFTLGAGHFGIQRLTLPESRNRLRKDPRIAEDKQAFRAAFARQTEETMWNGPFRWPVSGSIRTRYGLKRIVNRDPNYGWHKGYDIRGKTGTPVKAAAASIVALVRKCILEGNAIVLDHGYGVSTIYMHLSAFNVREGDRVQAGQVIGRVGNTGLSSGPHLHWGVYVGGVAVNPKFWLSQAPVRAPM